jgi:hypothetical protein
MLKIKKGNKAVLKISIVDSDNATVTNLATASAIYYMIKENETDLNANAILTKTVGSGIVVDSPSQGDLSITISPADTENLNPGTFYHAIQIEYSASDIQEINLKYYGQDAEKIKIEQDIIRS